MDELILLITGAAIVEAIWETSKMIWQNGKISIDRVGAIVVGVLVALVSQINIFATLDIPLKSDLVGSVLTGILLSRGANFVHDLTKVLGGAE